MNIEEVAHHEGWRQADREFLRGGDLARGGATVIRAMRDGKTAAAAIYEYLIGEDYEGTPAVQKASAAGAA